jgi:ubiquitin-like 1-activating enzyme E1 B
VLQAFHILKGQVERGWSAKDPELVQDCRYINCVRQPSRNGLLLIASKLEAPNPGCYVCRSATVHVSLNVPNWTLRDWLDRVLKADLGFVEPALLIEGSVVYEEGEEDYLPNLAKKLQDLPCGGIRHGTVLLVEDYSQDLSVEVVVSHRDAWPKKRGAAIAAAGDGGPGAAEDEEEDDDPFRFEIGGTKPTAAAAADGEAESQNGAKDEEEDDDDGILEVTEDPDVVGRGKKRPAEEPEDRPGPDAKKRRAQRPGDGDARPEGGGDVIEID